ncbi:MAG TPA: hypothetical protein PKZ67_06610 [Accumulibacter sp.]|uniref:hypothetical protein n=1 Tax=Accumulibacter sp. TaxID=2053492 RepID=UPI00287989F8|nr:hypothetical protein [Accumulibacter sp.]MDS4055500.1 hypothetical protein [Accumulibacter sp.]HND39046.1 hypothetical protein [Accumulibacter sp.]HNF91861.1 hypothetical protein [Accumulibacter sp.]HNO13263.1 hypothetical protein [Accumulibacter sp.]HNO73517.1 hypothetical protein [Accumulibacter sp.]
MPEACESLGLGLAHARSNCGAEGDVAEQRTKAERGFMCVAVVHPVTGLVHPVVGFLSPDDGSTHREQGASQAVRDECQILARRQLGN